MSDFNLDTYKFNRDDLVLFDKTIDVEVLGPIKIMIFDGVEGIWMCNVGEDEKNPITVIHDFPHEYTQEGYTRPMGRDPSTGERKGAGCIEFMSAGLVTCFNSDLDSIWREDDTKETHAIRTKEAGRLTKIIINEALSALEDFSEAA